MHPPHAHPPHSTHTHPTHTSGAESSPRSTVRSDYICLERIFFKSYSIAHLTSSFFEQAAMIKSYLYTENCLCLSSLQRLN